MIMGIKIQNGKTYLENFSIIKGEWVGIMGVKIDSEKNHVFEYDIAKKTFETIFPTGVECLKYRPNSNCISFQNVDHDTSLFNRDTKKPSVIVDDMRKKNH